VAEKPGIKTSEFWLTALAQILGMAMHMLAMYQDAEWAQVAGVCVGGALQILSLLGYQSARAKTKFAEAQARVLSANLEKPPAAS